jgi:hypothetical protein
MKDGKIASEAEPLQILALVHAISSERTSQLHQIG